jgi:hypothetical protein
MLASKTGISEAASIANLRWLAERKRKHFGYDRRMVLDLRTYDDDGQLRVMAAAAMPSDGASP